MKNPSSASASSVRLQSKEQTRCAATTSWDSSSLTRSGEADVSGGETGQTTMQPAADRREEQKQSVPLCYLLCADPLLALLFRPQAKSSSRSLFNSFLLDTELAPLLSTASEGCVDRLSAPDSTSQHDTHLQMINVFSRIQSKLVQLKKKKNQQNLCKSLGRAVPT